MDARLQRPRPEAGTRYAAEESQFRTDLERIRFAQSYSRLAEVTQVITAGATAGMVHNRLSHSIKVTAVARAIAVRLLRDADPALLSELGGLDHVVVQAGANAHDLGHPPFGHLGEQVLDEVVRTRFGLHDGFEGNAQTFRILTELEVLGPGDEGLNLTAASRAAVLKYPWGRYVVPDPHPSGWAEPPRGAGEGPAGPGSTKFSAYTLDLDEMLDALSAFPGLPPGRQTLECSIMDLADDIAYSLHDVEDFHRSGILQFSPVSGEFRSWLSDRRALAAMSTDELDLMGRWPGAGLEQLRRRLIEKDDWIFDEDRFGAAVATIGDEFVDGVLAAPYDGSRMADRAISGFVSRWIDHFISSVQLIRDPPVRSAYVTLAAEAWHQVSALKFVHQYFILDRPDLAMFQRGQARTIEALVAGFDDWLSDRQDAPKAPRRLVDLVRIATDGYERVAHAHPEWLNGATSGAELARMGRGRGIADFVSGLTDQQAVAFAQRLSGARELLWTSGAL